MTESRGERIKELLGRRGMTEAELAGKTGTTEASISRYIHNDRVPKADILANIAQALGATMDYLEKGSGWIPVGQCLPEEGKEVMVVSHGWENDFNDIYIGKLEHTPAGDGSQNFFGIPTPESEWSLWGWSYYRKPDVVAWRPLPEPYREE